MNANNIKGRIIGCRKDGLGARLLLMLNCMKLGQQFDVPFNMYWPREESLATNMEYPELLFSPKMLDQHFLTRPTYEKISKSAAPLWKFLSDTDPTRLKKHLQNGGNILVEEGFEIVLFPWEDDETIRKTYRGFFDHIDLVPPVKSNCTAIDKSLSTDSAGSLAYHLRRGDILNVEPWKHTVWPSKIEPDEYYEAHLKKNAQKTALIFSDSPQSIDRLKSQFPNLLAINDIIALDGLEPIQRDFLELYAMSRADEIIAPTLSAFSTAAARISGRQRLRFQKVLTDSDFETAHTSTTDRLLNRSDTYINVSDAAHAFSRIAIYLAHPDRFQTALTILNQLKNQGADNAFIDIHLAVSNLYLGNSSKAAHFARLAAAQPKIWPEDFASAKSIEAIAYGANDQRRKAGNAFREAFLFKPLRQDVILAGTNLLLKSMLNKHNFLPLDQPLMRQLHMKATEDRSSSYLVGKIINKRLRRDFRFVALDWHALVLDGKASRLKSDKAELTRMIKRLHQVDKQVLQKILPAYQSTKGQILAYLGDQTAYELLDAAIVAEPENPLYYLRAANIHLFKGQYDEAIAKLKIACELAPQNPFYAHALGMTYAQAGKQDKAIETLARASGSERTTAKIQADFAMVAMHMGEIELATDAMNQAIKRIPVFNKFQNQLKRIIDKR